MTSDVNAQVDSTALAVAACRALESSRDDALIADPFAAAFVAAAGNPNGLPTAWPHGDPSPLEQSILLGSIYIGVRTRFIDDYLANDRSGRQVVILGAGLDSRVFRLPWNRDTTVFELDSGFTLHFKQRVLDAQDAVPASDRRPVPVDIATDWIPALLQAGFTPSTPTTWVVEGLLPYLSADAQSRVLQGIARLSSPASRAVLERSVPLPSTPDLEQKLQAFSASTGLSMADLLARANPPDPAAFFKERGWRTVEYSAQKLAALYGRTLSLHPRAPQADADPVNTNMGETNMGETNTGETSAAEPARGGFVTAVLE